MNSISYSTKATTADMPRRQDGYSDVADDMAEWMESMSDELAGGLMGNGPAPFSQNLTKAEQLEFYTSAFFNPDGSENLMGREQQMQRLGPVGYANALRTVLDSIRREGTELRREPVLSVAMPSGAIAPDGLPSRT